MPSSTFDRLHMARAMEAASHPVLWVSFLKGACASDAEHELLSAARSAGASTSRGAADGVGRRSDEALWLVGGRARPWGMG